MGGAHVRAFATPQKKSPRGGLKVEADFSKIGILICLLLKEVKEAATIDGIFAAGLSVTVCLSCRKEPGRQQELPA
jgi:hypothetical protein